MKKSLILCRSLTAELKKLILIMKILFILLTFGVLQVSATAYSQSTMISLDMEDRSIREVLNEIEQSTEFRFFYNENFTDLSQKVDLVADHVAVEVILNQLLASCNVTYKVLENNLIVITPKSLYQQIAITGKVTDADTRESLPGVYVRVQGTNSGAVTDVDGNYSVNVASQSAVLVFSFIGYQEQSLTVGGQAVINIALVPSIQALDEVVVVGYGTQTKRSVTGAIQTIGTEELISIPVSQVTQSLQGKVAGFRLTRQAVYRQGYVNTSQGPGVNICRQQPAVCCRWLPYRRRPERHQR
jgi:hypothetical protein